MGASKARMKTTREDILIDLTQCYTKLLRFQIRHVRSDVWVSQTRLSNLTR